MPQKNQNISQIMPVGAALWADSDCDLSHEQWGAHGEHSQEKSQRQGRPDCASQ
jgi:hypothetical protein